MFEPDEYLFTKFAHYFKRRKKQKSAQLSNLVKLSDIKTKLELIARAASGRSIEIFEAEREGGYKNDNFFLPGSFSEMNSIEENISFYYFRVLYLSIQNTLDLNWNDKNDHDLESSQSQAKLTSEKVLIELFDNFPPIESFYIKLKSHFESKKDGNKTPDFSFLYGKWMRNQVGNKIEEISPLDKSNKNLEKEAEQTIIKAKAVEEIISVQIDLKQQEDAVLQHQFEKVETAEEFSGNFRDFDGEDELDDHSNALEDINMKYSVRVNDKVHSTYQTDFIENTTIAESAEVNNSDYHIKYPEWDYKRKAYKPDFCSVYPTDLAETNPNFYKRTLNDHRSVLLGLRKMLSNLNTKYQQQRRQPDGNEFDLDAVTDLFIEARSGHTPSERIYLSNKKQEKDLSIMLLIDVSLSSDGYSAGNKVIDVEKQVSILFGEILNEYGIDFAINGFSSNTRNHSNFIKIKGFDDSWDKTKLKVGAISPNGYTRIGAALRHAGSLIENRPTKNKWVILISDGKPNDYDKYEGQYGVKDVKQALRELNQNQVNTYALAIEAEAKYYLPEMFGQNHYQILSSPVELIQSLVKLYEKIKHKS